jgi:hypothetical protein
MAEPFFMKLSMYIMALEPILSAYFINPSHQSCMSMCIPLLLLGNESVKYLGNEYTCNNKRIVEHVISREVGDSFFPELPVY